MIGEWGGVLQGANTDTIDGSIFQSIFWFSIPPLMGNLFQQLYSTMDSYVIGNFVNTNALAAVGALTPVTNVLIGFFMGLSTGAGVVISQYFGAKQGETMSRAVHSAVALTGLLSIVFTGLELLYTGPPLKAIGVPEDVPPHSSLYLMIYLRRITFSLFYNMGLGTPHMVGDLGHPLLYLAVASIMNIILNFTFVCGPHMDIAGVTVATIMAQAVSSSMVMHKLMHTHGDYKVEIRGIWFHKKMIRKIIASDFPAVCQQSTTSFSNVVVWSYINRFGTAAMVGHSATLRIGGFLQLPLQSLNMTITTFVGQSIGARKRKRVKKEIFAARVMSFPITLTGSVGMYFGTPLLINVLTNGPRVVEDGSSMPRVFSRAYIMMPVIQVLSGALRGAGLSKVPMSFILGSFVVLRQIYLLVTVSMTRSLTVVTTGWPTTWAICAAGMFLYYAKADWLPKEAGPEGE